MYLSALLALFAPVVWSQATNCSDYCTQIQTVCTGANAQFGTDPTIAGPFCGAVCLVYPMTGAVNDTTGDSFNCRAYHLQVAKTSTTPDAVAAHCTHAGFYGGGVCGNLHNNAVTPLSSAIDFQCDFAKQYCGATDSAACYSNYSNYALFVADSVNPLNTKTFFKATGNTLQCRTYNALQVLAGTSASEACNSGGAISSTCSVDCNDFCLLQGSTCGFGTTGNNQFASNASCLEACRTWDAAPVAMQQPIATGDTSGCRWYHLFVAASNGTTSATTHCPHTGNWPDATNGYCVSSCAYYCQTITAACTGSNMQFTDNTACMSACAAYTKLSQPYNRPVTVGNNLECRTYHAEVAYASAANAATHCPHAGNMSTTATCGGSNGASSVKVGVATAFLLLVGVASSILGF